MPRTPDNTAVAPGTTRGNHDGGMAMLLADARKRKKPAQCTEDSQTLGYLRTYVQCIAYLEPKRQGENTRTFRGRVYWTLRALEAGTPPRVMRILQLYPAAHWERIWINLHNCWTTESVKLTWYMVIRDILPTNERLYKIQLADSPLCRQCGALDTVLRRVTECGEGARIWEWTKRRIAWILHTDPANIPPDRTRPQFQLWPPTRNRTVL
jgi:hypothetical protein